MKRRIISVFVILSMVLSLMPFFNISVSAAGVKPSGSGTVSDPFLIGDVNELIWFRENVNNGSLAQAYQNANLKNNIDLNNANWTPIGAPSYPYKGTFDGKNYTINNFTCNWTATNVGFFGDFTGIVRNLHIKNGYLRSTGTAQAGGIISTMYGGSAENCSFVGRINFQRDAGGIVGQILNVSSICKITDCYAYVTAESSASNAFGVMYGLITGSNLTIARCYGGGEYTAKSSYYDLSGGGFVGWTGNGSVVDIENSYYLGDVSQGAWNGMVASSLGSNAVINIRKYFYYNKNHKYGSANTIPLAGTTSNNSGGVGTINVYNGFWLASTSDGISLRTEEEFKNQSIFTGYGWDFEGKDGNPPVWTMGTQYPELQSVDLSSISRTIEVYDTEFKDFNLPDYFYLVRPRDQNYNQGNKRFTFSVEGENSVTKTVQRGIDIQGNPITENVVHTIGTVSDDTITIDGTIGVDTYPLTIKAHDNTGVYKDFTFDLTIVVKHKVPVPKVLTNNIPYNRSLSLAGIPLTTGWVWSDSSLCPKDNVRWPQGYEAFYQYEDGKKDYYDYSDVTAAGYTVTYDAERNGITVMMKNFVTESEFSPWDTTVTVLDGDTLAPIKDAEVSCDYEDEFPYGNKTAANGTVKAQLSKGNRTIRATATGYQDGEDTFEIKANNNNTATLKLEPVRYSFALPAVHDKDNPTEEIENARVNVVKLDGVAHAWNGADTSLTADAKADTVLPDGKYVFTSATYGYTKDDKIWAVVSGDTITYYNNEACSAGTEVEGILYASKMTEPLYHMQINKDSGSDDSYTVTVSLKNIKATYGTFGLRWDNKLFDMQSFTLGSGLDSSMTVEEAYGGTTTMESANANGYYDFMWMTDDETDSVFDTETEKKTVATIKFKIKDKNRTDEITVDSFGIKPWSETKASKANVASLRPTDEDDTYMYWRKTDTDNSPSNLKEGRIADYKTAVNVQEATPIASTVETGGFFQGWVNGSLADPKNATTYDIMSEVEYGFKITNAVIRFHAFNEVTGEDLEKVLIRMFNSYQQIVGNDKTDDNGIVTYSVNTTGKANPTFTYNAALDGYWPIPLSGLLSDRPVVEAEQAKVTDVEVPMEQKIYHKPVLKRNTAEDGQPETLELVTDAQLGGEKFAYNDRPYHFRVKAARGYRILAYPTEADVYVNDKKIATLNPDVNGLFTLSASEMSYANNEDLRALQEAELTTLSTTDTDYEDWSGSQPDSEGFRGYNVVVKFDNYEVTELEYIVEGVTNDLGHVTYTPGDGDNAAKTQTDRDSDTYYEYIMVQTQKSHPELDPPTAANHRTGTFTFAPDQEGYLVEKVYINGLRINTYDDMPGFDYTFGIADMDCNITVIYYDGVNPSDDTIMTLVVGEFGFADLKKPEPAEDDIILTRRVFLNPTDDLEFEAHAMKGFELYKVEKEVEGQSRVDVTTAARNGAEHTVTKEENGTNVDYTYIPYKVSKPTADEKDITVYVSYKDPRASKTPNLFVKSYVYSGEGVNKPAGILIYSLYDSVEIDLEANTAASYKVKGVMLSPYEDLEKIEEWDFPQPYEDKNTYRYDSLTSDLAIGAIYTEKTYKVHGYVDLSQKTNLTKLEPSTGAVITFVRLEGDSGDTERRLRPIKVMAPTTISRKNAQFTADLPEGRWNVYVTKQGYVTYKLTEYTFAANPELPDDHVYEFCDDKVIVPYIGSAVTGELINVRDAAYVKSGMREGINEVARLKADVDNDDNVCYRDLMYIWHNYNQRTVEQLYSDFASRGSVDVKAGPTE